MARDDGSRIVTAILVVVNECLGILGIQQLDRKQQEILACILTGMARRHRPMQTPFNRRLVDVMRMQPGDEQRRALCAVLGTRLQ